MSRLSDERIRQIATFICNQNEANDLSDVTILFARAIEREAYKQGQERMRERAATTFGETANSLAYNTLRYVQQHIRKLEIEEPK